MLDFFLGLILHLCGVVDSRGASGHANVCVYREGCLGLSVHITVQKFSLGLMEANNPVLDHLESLFRLCLEVCVGKGPVGTGSCCCAAIFLRHVVAVVGVLPQLLCSSDPSVSVARPGHNAHVTVHACPVLNLHFHLLHCHRSI